MLRRMHRDRMTVSLTARSAARVRQCGAETPGGASGYLERLVRQDELREAAGRLAAWYAARPSYLEDAEVERLAAEDDVA